MQGLSVPDILKMVVIGLAAYYGSLRAIEKRLAEIDKRHAILSGEVKPIITWWNRLSQNAADRMFIKTRAADAGGNGS